MCFGIGLQFLILNRCNDLYSSNSSSMDLVSNNNNNSSSNKPPPRASTKAGWQDLPSQQTDSSKCLQVGRARSSALSWFASHLGEPASSWCRW